MIEHYDLLKLSIKEKRNVIKQVMIPSAEMVTHIGSMIMFLMKDIVQKCNSQNKDIKKMKTNIIMEKEELSIIIYNQVSDIREEYMPVYAISVERVGSITVFKARGLDDIFTSIVDMICEYLPEYKSTVTRSLFINGIHEKEFLPIENQPNLRFECAVSGM